MVACQNLNLNYLCITINYKSHIFIKPPISIQLDAHFNKLYANKINPHWIFYLYHLAYLILFDLLAIEIFRILVVY